MPIVEDKRGCKSAHQENVRLHFEELKRIWQSQKQAADMDILELTAHLPDSTPITIRLPGKKEWRYEFGAPGEEGREAETGELEEESGQDRSETGGAGLGHVEHTYEITMDLGEYRDIVFPDDWELPPPESTITAEKTTDEEIRFKGFREVGIDAHLARRQVGRNRLKRFRLTNLPRPALSNFPYKNRDRRYYFVERRPKGQKAVAVAGRDTSGSITEQIRKLIRRIMFNLCRWVMRRYPEYIIIYLGHDDTAYLISNYKIFLDVTSGGGTRISSYFEMVEQIERGGMFRELVAPGQTIDALKPPYPREEHDYYGFYAGDGDNAPVDIERCKDACERVSEWMRFIAYIEIQQGFENNLGMAGNKMSSKLKKLSETLPRKNLAIAILQNESQIRQALDQILAKEASANVGA